MIDASGGTTGTTGGAGSTGSTGTTGGAGSTGSTGTPGTVTVMGLDDVGLPEPVTLDRGALRDVLIKNPDLIVETVRDVMTGGGQAGGGPMPMNTPITAMVSPSQAQRLSDNAKRLTKADLLALGGWGVQKQTTSAYSLDVKDVSTIKDIFAVRLLPADQRPAGVSEEAFSLCCCCCPCCTAAAVKQPVRPVS